MANVTNELRNVDAVLVRYGEIGIKSDRVRSRYERTLINNIKKMLDFCAIPHGAIIRDFGRIFIETNDGAVARAVACVFGVVSASPVQKHAATLDVLQSAAVQIISPLLTGGKSFGIRARRTGTHDYSSRDIANVVGRAIEQATKAPVRLSRPDVRLFIEVRADSAYLYTKIVEGVGGLPLGTQGKLIALISGGIDSPVAAWLMMKRGCTIVPVFFDCDPYIDKVGRERANAVVKALAVWAGRPLDFAVVRHGACLTEFRKVAPKMTCVLCKRMMYKVASQIAQEENAHGIVTGESIGQVASQTTHNLFAIDGASDVPIYRPLIGLDKTENIKLARRIGTYRLSTAGDSHGCTAVDRHPTTNADQKELQKYEADLLAHDLSAKEANSLTWQRIFPNKSFGWVLDSEQTNS